MTKLVLTWILSTSFALGSLIFDQHTAYKYLMFPRSGAVITCFSVLLPLIRFRYSEAFSDIDKATDELLRDHGLVNAPERAARRFLKISRTSSFALAIAGTLIWAFGDFVKTGFP